MWFFLIWIKGLRTQDVVLYVVQTVNAHKIKTSGGLDKSMRSSIEAVHEVHRRLYNLHSWVIPENRQS